MSIDFWDILLLLTLYGLILIPMISIVGFHVLLFIIQKRTKKIWYKLPYLKNKERIIKTNSLVSFAELAYLFRKDSTEIISTAIKNKWLIPLYKNSVVTIKNEEHFECYEMYFESGFFNCYDNFINNVYFLKEHIINVKNIFESTLLSDDFYVSEEKITTEENILNVLRNCIKNIYYVDFQITSFKELKNMLTYLTVQIVRSCIFRFYGMFFLEKPNLMYQKDKIEKYYNELICNVEEVSLTQCLFVRSKELFIRYVNKLGKITNNEKLELYFWGRLFIPANELVDILDPGKQTPDAKRQKAYTARRDFKKQFSGRGVKMEDVMPLLHKEFSCDNLLD